MPRRGQHRKRRRFQLEQLESRRLLAAMSGATDLDLAEFLVGKVAVTPIFFESDGSRDESTEDWTPEEITENLQKISDGVNWWSDLLDTMNTVHTLDFVIDDTFATDPVETAWEPIANTSNDYSRYLSQFLIDEGYSGNSLNRAMQLFNNEQRVKHDADWAFTIIMVDASNDADGFFERNGQGFLGAFAFTYGSFMVTPSSRPASTIAHEMGHIFQAFDEYPGPADWTRRGGYYNTQNLNAADNPTPGFVQEPSIMRSGIALNDAYASFESPESTLSLVGWRDSDGDGVFDFADVPLQLDAVGYLDSDASVYRFTGNAEAVPLLNLNSSILNFRSDITPNVVSEIQYRIDGGEWITAAQPEQPKTDFDLEVPVPSSFNSIEFRAIDTSSGITSPIIAGNQTQHSFDDNGIRGFAYLDKDGNGQRDASDELLPNTSVTIRRTDGGTMLQGVIRASEHNGLLTDLDGVTLAAEGALLSSTVLSMNSDEALAQPVFFSENTIADPIEQSERWDQDAVLLATFDQAVGEVGVTAIGLDRGSHVRIAGYDASNQLIARSTSDLIPTGETADVLLTDPLGRIKSVRIFGQGMVSPAEYSFGAAISEIRFGSSTNVTTGADGAFRFPNVAAGDYTLEFASDSVIRGFQNPSVDVQVTAESDAVVDAIAINIDSPYYNALLPFDVDGSGAIAPLDVVLIINDLADNGFRTLGANESTAFMVDVNNDGSATPLDALLVINFIADRSASGERIEASQSRVSVPMDSAPQDAVTEATDQAISEWTNNQIPKGYLAGPNAMPMSTMFNSAGEPVDTESPNHSTTDTRYVEHDVGRLNGKNTNKQPDSPSEAKKLETFPLASPLKSALFRSDFAELDGEDPI